MSDDDKTYRVLTGLDAAPGEGGTGAETVITRDIEILLLSPAQQYSALTTFIPPSPLHQPGAVSRVTSWRPSGLLPPTTGGYNGLQASHLGKRENISGQSPAQKRRVGDLL